MKNVRAISSLFNTNADCTEDRKAKVTVITKLDR